MQGVVLHGRGAGSMGAHNAAALIKRYRASHENTEILAYG